jgi:hypothetical protein
VPSWLSMNSPSLQQPRFPGPIGRTLATVEVAAAIGFMSRPIHSRQASSRLNPAAAIWISTRKDAVFPGEGSVRSLAEETTGYRGSGG